VSTGRRINLANVLTPVVPGREADLAAHLSGLTGADPFAQVAEVHVARWVVIGDENPDPGASRDGLRMQYLLFSCAFNGSFADLVEALRLRAGPTIDGIWGHCVNYPGHAARRELHRYLTHTRLSIDQRFVAYDGTVAEIRAALDLRRRHIEFALTAQSLNDDDLQKEFLRHFAS
jgi:hypothetical protein